MCGILGSLPSTEEHFFRGALDKIAHRGPDGYGIWSDESGDITLGHRRLAILDLSEKGKQPMLYGRFAITFNGEIYNFVEIKKELSAKGHQFFTESDTEVVLAAYQQWGKECLLKFNGMWAVAIWDRQKKELFLSRDRFGKKPLFYAFVKGRFVFASEMKAIFPFLPEVRVADDFDELKNDIFGYENTEKCLVHGVKRFPSGSYGFLDTEKQQVITTKFWDTKDHLREVPKRYEEQVEEFRELFIDACRIRMRSDVPIGTALSGGLDSSATICTMSHIGKQHTGNRVSEDWQHAFVATFPDTFIDESVFAKQVVDHIGIKATFLPINSKAIENIEQSLYLFEELYLTSPIPMMETYKAVKQNGVTVTIDGHGADELFSGYGHLPWALLDAGHRLDKVKDILSAYQGMQDFDTVQLDKKTYNWEWYKKYMVSSIGGGNKEFIIYLLRSLLGRIEKEKPSQAKFGFLNKQLYTLFHQTVLPILLRNYDRYAMASGVEIRMPFMDYRLVSFCFSLPWESKLRNGYTKSILRDAMKGILPEPIRLRKTKIGFNTPIVDWIKGEWKQYLLDLINSTDFKQSSVVNPKEVSEKIMMVMNKPDAKFVEGEQAWIALTPYLWEKALIKNYKKYE